MTNTEDGVKIVYYEKLHIALQHWQDVKDANPEATKWTAKQLEDSAVGKYGPYAGVGWNWHKQSKRWKQAPPLLADCVAIACKAKYQITSSNSANNSPTATVTIYFADKGTIRLPLKSRYWKKCGT